MKITIKDLESNTTLDTPNYPYQPHVGEHIRYSEGAGYTISAPIKKIEHNTITQELIVYV